MIDIQKVTEVALARFISIYGQGTHPAISVVPAIDDGWDNLAVDVWMTPEDAKLSILDFAARIVNPCAAQLAQGVPPGALFANLGILRSSPFLVGVANRDGISMRAMFGSVNGPRDGYGLRLDVVVLPRRVPT